MVSSNEIKAIDKIKVLILGSCVSRDAFEFDSSGTFQVVDYYPRTSLASIYACDHKVELKSLPNISSPFQKKSIERDFNKDFITDLPNIHFDVLLLDLIDDRFDLAEAPNGAYFTVSNELIESGFDFDKCRNINSRSNEKFHIWELGWQKFIKHLASINVLQKLYVNAPYWASTTTDGMPFHEDYVEENNLLLRRIYKRIAKDLPFSQILSFDKNNCVAADNHKWGSQPFHYKNEFYIKLLRQIYLRQIKPNLFLVTRFSLFLPGAVDWNLSKDDLNYTPKLFDDKRLSARFFILSSLSIPLIEMARGILNIKHIIQYSDNLPQKYIELLKGLQAKHPFIILQCTKNTAPDAFDIINNQIDTGESFAVANLDDDDIVGNDFFVTIAEHIKVENAGFYVSMPSGFTGYLDFSSRKIDNIRKVHRKFINIGLTRICQKLGDNDFIAPKIVNHVLVDKTYPSIIDPRTSCFFWIRSQEQDTTSQSAVPHVAIMKDMDNFPIVKDYQSVIQSFCTLNGLLEVNTFEQVSLLDSPVNLTDEFFIIDVSKFTHSIGKLIINYQLECGDDIIGNNALLALRFNDVLPDAFNGFARSPSDAIGWYRYLRTSPGIVDATVSIDLHCGNPHSIIIRAWNAKSVIALTRLSASYQAAY